MRVHTPGITKATIAMATTLGTHPTFISSNGVMAEIKVEEEPWQKEEEILRLDNK